MEYMVIRFSDNDFGMTVDAVMRTLTNDVSTETIAASFTALQPGGHLKELFLQAFKGMYTVRKLSYALRMGKIKETSEDFDLAEYLRPSLRIDFYAHASDFNHEHGNGECLWYHLRTGEFGLY